MSGSKIITGVIGDPISHSLSPFIHNGWYHKLGLDYEYQKFHVLPSELGDFLSSMNEKGISGINVTIPHKETVIPFLNFEDEGLLAQNIGAANTIVNRDGQLFGYSTDGDGFFKSINYQWVLQISGKKIVILGAGGSARAIGFSAMAHKASSIVFANRTLNRASHLVQDFSYHVPSNEHNPFTATTLDESLIPLLKDADLVINTTSVGMFPNNEDCPLSDMSWVKKGQYVYDIIYKPQKTVFLKQAEERGAKILNGLGMLVGQAAIAFAYFTGQEISEDLFLETLNHIGDQAS